MDEKNAAHPLHGHADGRGASVAGRGDRGSTNDNHKSAQKRDGRGTILAALKAAFPYTVPIFAGFWFLGLTYGIYMHTMGFSWVYPTLMALFIFGGSLEFVIAGMLASAFAPVTVLMVTLAVQARHLFYGIAMLPKYKDTGWMKPYLIFGMCDETFSILYTAEVPEGVDRRWFMFFVTLLNHMYWVAGAAIGGLAGSLVAFDTQGLSFVMTALFVVIFIEQWLKEKQHLTASVGFVASVACLVAFGADNFMLPALACMLVTLALLRKPLSAQEPLTAPDAVGREAPPMPHHEACEQGAGAGEVGREVPSVESPKFWSEGEEMR